LTEDGSTADESALKENNKVLDIGPIDTTLLKTLMVYIL